MVVQDRIIQQHSAQTLAYRVLLQVGAAVVHRIQVVLKQVAQVVQVEGVMVVLLGLLIQVGAAAEMLGQQIQATVDQVS